MDNIRCITYQDVHTNFKMLRGKFNRGRSHLVQTVNKNNKHLTAE